MDKKPLIGVSIGAVVLLILGSLTNVVGYQSVQSPNPYPIVEQVKKEKIQSSNSECDCENKNLIFWHPCICTLLLPIFIILFLICHMFGVDMMFVIALERLQEIGLVLHCFWSKIPVP
jgi:hypothetical protein